MNKFTVILILTFITGFLAGQTIDVKEIVTVKPFSESDMYAFSYDKSGTYIFAPYDTVTQKYTLYSNKGETVIFDNVNYWYTVFDEAGNYYMFANDKVNDSIYNNHFIKNGKILATYSDITGSLKMRDGKIYFASMESEKYHLYSYNTLNGEMIKGKGYNRINLIYYPIQMNEGEPVGELGFKKDGTPYYLAEEKGEKFVVFGDKEEKHYSDIDVYAFAMDGNDVLTYFAKDKGSFYIERGNSFVVQGTKEYKKFDYLYMPLEFDKSNNPIYIGIDSVDDKISKHHLMNGNTEIETSNDYFGTIYYTPSGKMSFVKTETFNNNTSKSYLFVDGKKYKAFHYIYMHGFTKDELPVYTASSKEYNHTLMIGNKAVSKTYDFIAGVKILPDGKIAYAGNNFENKEKNKEQEFFVYIGDKRFGPFNDLGTINYSMDEYILYKDGVYAFIESKTIDKENYVTEKTIHGNNWKNGKFEWVNFSVIYNSKVIYLATTNIKENQVTKDAVYMENKKVTEDFDIIMNFTFDEKTGKLEFIGVKGNTFYSVKIQF